MIAAPLSPLEAHERVMAFAGRLGESALRLALHASVPQVLRPELLHLLRLNFVAEVLDDAAVESDVLFASFCEHLGNGYYRLDRNVRLQLLGQLDRTYEHDAVLRTRQVAEFMLAYFDQQTRNVASGADPLYASYVEVQRWVALAFLDPEAAATQLAAAVRQACQSEMIAARVQIGGLASALSAPLARYQTLLAYAAGLDALQAGKLEEAEEILGDLDDDEVQVGSVTLPAPQRLLAERAMPASEPAVEGPEAEEEVATPGSGAETSSTRTIYISHSGADAEWAARLQRALAPIVSGLGLELWSDRSLRPGQNFKAEITRAIDRAQIAILLVSPDFLASDFIMNSELPLLLENAARQDMRLTWVCLRHCLWDQSPLAQYQAAHDPSTPLSSLSGYQRDRALFQIARAVQDLATTSSHHADKRRAPRIFISYRPEKQPDQDAATALLSRLSRERFQGAVAMSPPLLKTPEEFLEDFNVVLVVIGPRWLQLAADPEDGPRRTVAAALSKNMPMIPVLIEGAGMPSPREMPPEIAMLARLQAITLSAKSWENDSARLIEAVEQVAARVTEQPAVHATGGDAHARPTKLRIFVSSVIRDLVEHREALRKTLDRLGHDVVEATEDGVAYAGTPLRKALEAIGRCDVVVCLVGSRHGFIPPGGTESITEMEYGHAIELKKPTLVFVQDSPDVPHTSRYSDPEAMAVERFRARLRQNSLVRSFETPADLAYQVSLSLASLVATGKAKQKEAAAGRVLLFVGHGIDIPGRQTPRFPASLERAAEAAIERVVTKELDRGGPVVLALSSASQGGDLLFQDVCLRLGLAARAFIPFPEDEFRKRAVAPGGKSWLRRFDWLWDAKVIEHSFDPVADESTTVDLAWERNTTVMFERALAHGAQNVTLIALWDGMDSGAPGGTADVVRRARAAGIEVVIIDVGRLADASQVDSPTAPSRWVELGLNDRQGRIANLIVKGLTYDAVAKELSISRTAVRNDLIRVFEKLGITSRAELALMYAQAGPGQIKDQEELDRLFEAVDRDDREKGAQTGQGEAIRRRKRRKR